MPNKEIAFFYHLSCFNSHGSHCTGPTYPKQSFPPFCWQPHAPCRGESTWLTSLNTNKKMEFTDFEPQLTTAQNTRSADTRIPASNRLTSPSTCRPCFRIATGPRVGRNPNGHIHHAWPIGALSVGMPSKRFHNLGHIGAPRKRVAVHGPCHMGVPKVGRTHAGRTQKGWATPAVSGRGWGTEAGRGSGGGRQ